MRSHSKFWWPVVLVLALVCGGGCVTQSSHTEGDREVQQQTQAAAEFIVAAMDEASAFINANKCAEAKASLQKATVAANDVVLNMKQQQGVHGPPENKPPYSPENSDKARKKSDGDHESGKWVKPVLGILAAVGGVAATLAGMPWLAQLFPVLTGKIGKMAKAGVAIVNTVRDKAEKNGGSIDVKTVMEIAQDKNVSAGIQDLVKKEAHKHEEAMGMNLTSLETMKEADDTGAPVATPPDAPVAPAAPVEATAAQ